MTTPATVAPRRADSAAAGAAGIGRATLRELALAALAAHGGLPEAGTDDAAEARFLRGRAAAAGLAAEAWTTALRDLVADPPAADRPLLALAGDLRLTWIETLAVALALLVDEEPMVGRAVAFLQVPLAASRPTVGLLVTALGDALGREPHGVGATTPVDAEGDEAGARAAALDALTAGNAIGAGLLELSGDGAPLPEQAVLLPAHVRLALRGLDGGLAGTSMDAEADAPPLPPATLRTAVAHAAALRAEGAGQALHLRSASPREGRAVAAAIARAMGRRALFIERDDAPALAPLLLLRALLPVFTVELAPGERRTLPAIPHYDGPVLVLCGLEGSVDVGGRLAVQWTIPVPSVGERAALWERVLGDGALARELALEHRQGAGRIVQLGVLARHRATLDGRATPDRDDVEAASWSLEGGGLDGLAQPITDRVPDHAFVTAPALQEDMRALLLRCRARDGLTNGLGAAAAARYRPGVRALFVGPSGTGKTLGAIWLATRLRLPLYRVDLAAVTSKYIGETEKNLARLLARAEHAELILLFDEADSLFGKRTDVRDANDRFANAQTNYLLQRIETFDGIALLTSNSRARFDPSFTRRLDAVIDFTLPGPDERRALWRAHLGDGHRLDARELNRLAAHADLAGGHVRNAVLAAAVFAAHEREPIALRHVLRGLAAEYRKLGRQLPAPLRADGGPREPS